MAKDIFNTAKWLVSEETNGYGTWRIPHEFDIEISKLIQRWLNLDELSRNAALSQISEDYQFVFLAYSERMASLAVRDHNREYIFLGLLALGLDGWRFDWRENLLVVCLHYDAAKRIGLNPDELFEEAAKLLPNEASKGLQAFLRRPEKDKSLEAMGYVTTTDADGFRYERMW